MSHGNKKDAKYLNVHMDRTLYEQFSEFCHKYGFTKTSATEIAIRMYMAEMEKRMKAEVPIADAK